MFCEVPVSSVMVILSSRREHDERNQSDNNRNEQSFIVSEDEYK